MTHEIRTPVSIPPTHKTALESWEFEYLFTGTEIRQIEQATATNDDVYKFWRLAGKSNQIHVDHPVVIAGMQHIVDDVSISIDLNRRDVILQGLPL